MQKRYCSFRGERMKEIKKGCGKEIRIMDWKNNCYKYVKCGEEDYLCSECAEEKEKIIKHIEETMNPNWRLNIG
jgi:hypothetical protein